MSQIEPNTYYDGPIFISLIMQVVQTTVIGAQLVSFSQRAHAVSRPIRVLVIFLATMSLGQTILICHSTWLSFVSWTYTRADVKGGPLSFCIFQVLLSAPVQAAYTWRCYVILKRRALLPCIIAVGIVGGSALFMATGIMMAAASELPSSSENPIESTDPVDAHRGPLNYPYFLAFVGTLVTDIALTTILLLFLRRSLQHTYSPQARSTVLQIISIACEAAVPPAVCAAVAAVLHLVFVTRRSQLLWDLVPLGMLGKLHVIAFMATVNASGTYAQTDPPDISQSVMPPMDTMVVLETVHETSSALLSSDASPPPSFILDDAKGGRTPKHQV